MPATKEQQRQLDAAIARALPQNNNTGTPVNPAAIQKAADARAAGQPPPDIVLPEAITQNAGKK